MMINIRETAMVKPAAETPKRKLWNSNLDLIVPRHHTQTVYFYRRPAESGDGFFESERMKEALAEVLVPFYPMAGRLARDDDEKGRVEIDCNGEGVLFVVAETESTVEDFGDFAPTVEMMKLIPAVEYSDDISSFPLLVLQVTHFSCGGAAVGVGMLHIIADGYSGIHFINSWSNFARGLPFDPTPFIDRTLLRARNPPAPSFPHIEYHHPPALIAAIPPAAVAVNIFPLSGANLDQLRSKAPGSTRFSSYSLIAAHVWRCACLARGLPPEQLSKLHIAVDGRRRLRPPLPAGYFGNVVFTAAPVAKARELAEGIGAVAGRIQEAVGRMEDEYVRSAVDYLEMKGDLKEMVRGAHTFGCPNIGIISWTRMAIYEADFGWGKPVFMGPAGIAYEGMSFVLPAAGGGGGVSVVISLQMDHMARFKQLFYQFEM